MAKEKITKQSTHRFIVVVAVAILAIYAINKAMPSPITTAATL